jgi:methylated-DNA-[protein]-cysteine S-methyltransferase
VKPGLSFQDKVIELMKRIPKGRVTTYKEIAVALKVKAYRAVGNAVGKNPYAPHVPCHRVVRSDGTIGNYGNGVQKKILLLKKEGVRIKGTNRDAKIVNFENVLFKFE